MAIKDYPCRNCQKRETGCHDSCKEYKEVKAEHDKQAAEMRYIKKREQDVRGFAIDTHNRIMKRMHKRCS